jgi:hypothetical protein
MTTQAHPPSEAQQLRDARIANDQLRVRLAEQEALVAQERARADRAEKALRMIMVSAADSGECHLSGDCEIEGRADDCGICEALILARAALEKQP